MTVVFSGSLGSDARMWEPQSKAGIRGVVAEHPGHGGAPVAAVADVRDLAAGALAHVEDERFSFVGVSLGGAVGMRIALDSAERLDRLVLVCTSARFGEPQLWEERAATVREDGLEAIVDAVLERWFTRGFGDVRRYREMFLATDAEGYACCCEAVRDADLGGRLGTISAPTLVIAGADDPAAPPDQAELIRDSIPSASLELIPNAAHLANIEQPAAITQAILDYLSPVVREGR